MRDHANVSFASFLTYPKYFTSILATLNNSDVPGDLEINGLEDPVIQFISKDFFNFFRLKQDDLKN